MMYNKSVYELELHETAHSEDTNSRVLRVPGGWIYGNYHAGANQLTETFVPFDNEFQHVAPEDQG